MRQHRTDAGGGGLTPKPALNRKLGDCENTEVLVVYSERPVSVVVELLHTGTNDVSSASDQHACCCASPDSRQHT